MKKYFLIAKIITFFFICIDAFAQDFFPLNVGNQYQIKDDWHITGPGNYHESGTDYYDYSVLKDTLIEGEIFYAIPSLASGLFTGDYFYRYDTLEQKVLIRLPGDDTTRLAVDFNTPQDSHYISYIRGIPKEFISEGLSLQTVLGDTHLVYIMNHMGGSPFSRIHYYFSDKIGLYKYSYFSGYMSSTYQSIQYLISAIIDSIALRPIILEIDTLYPIFDRPIDTFPFLLTAHYYSSYYGLIDSFYLSVEQIRSDTIVSRTRFNISIYSPTINFYIPDLQVGDILRLRAKISDVSIYNNVNFYPDTGLIIINVHPPILEVETENRIYSYKLGQNYPNPFNPITTITYSIPDQDYVSLIVYNALGQKVANLINEVKATGIYEVEFGGDNLTSGIYFYQLKAGNFVETKKMIMLK